MTNYRVERLGRGDESRAKLLFSLMAEIFEESHDELSDTYVDRLLARDDTWVLAAFAGDEIVGGLTAHVLSMTRAESREVFIYDVAVRADHQRRGVGRLLMSFLQRMAAEAEIGDIFVPADNDDPHALEFYRAMGGTPSAVTIFTF